MASSEPVIAVRGLRKAYRRGLLRKTSQALDGVDLAVERGSVFGLLGPNGAGKTTFVKVMLGLVPHFEGEAQLLGQPVGHAATRRRVGFLPESHRFPGYLTARQTLRLSGMLCGRERAWLDQRIDAWLERVDMLPHADQKLRTYSKGMQQRVGLVHALLHEPDVVFLDEPTDGVDPVGRAKVREIVKDVRARGTTVFINSHLLMEVQLMCDQVVLMQHGRVLRSASMDDFTRSTGRVRFELDAAHAGLPELLAGLGNGLIVEQARFELELEDAAIDAVIDRLRARAIGIRAIVRDRQTLEQTFIDLVGGNAK
jgi:ABC-2 type transport system ATP-binding protein